MAAVETIVNYFHPDEARTFYPGTAGYQRRRYNTKTVTINDLRGREDDFSLDKNGFQILKAQWSEHDVEDTPEHIQGVVFPETIAKVKEAYVPYTCNLNHSLRSRLIYHPNQNRRHRSPPLLAPRPPTPRQRRHRAVQGPQGQ